MEPQDPTYVGGLTDVSGPCPPVADPGDDQVDALEVLADYNAEEKDEVA